MKASQLALFCFGLVAAAACAADPAPVDNTGGTTGPTTGGVVTSTPTSTTTTTTGGTPTTTGGTVATSTTSTTATATVATNTTSTTTTSTTGGAGGATSTTASSTTSATTTCTASAAATGPVAINPNNGWVACDTNTVGIEGAFFTYSDGVGSTIMPDTFEAAGTEICVTGEVGQVVDGDYSVWGAGLGFNFADEAAWDAAAQGISGVSFNISALPAGTETRIIFSDGAGVDHCASITAAGAQSFAFADTSVDCWEAGGATPSASNIVSVKWQVATNAESTHAFDFCITDLQVIP